MTILNHQKNNKNTQLHVHKVIVTQTLLSVWLNVQKLITFSLNILQMNMKVQKKEEVH